MIIVLYLCLTRNISRSKRPACHLCTSPAEILGACFSLKFSTILEFKNLSPLGMPHARPCATSNHTSADGKLTLWYHSSHNEERWIISALSNPFFFWRRHPYLDFSDVALPPRRRTSASAVRPSHTPRASRATSTPAFLPTAYPT